MAKPPKNTHGRKPPPPVRNRPTRSTFDDCGFVFLVMCAAGVTGLVAGLALVIGALA